MSDENKAPVGYVSVPPDQVQARIADSLHTLRHLVVLPTPLFLPGSTFPAEYGELLARHLALPPSTEATDILERRTAFYSNPNAIFFHSRVSVNEFGHWMYDKVGRTLERLDRTGSPTEAFTMKLRDATTSDEMYPHTITTTGYRNGLDEKRISIQARTTNQPVFFDYRGQARRPILKSDVAEWLGQGIIDLAKSQTVTGTWLPYVRTLLGLSDKPFHLDSSIAPTVITIPLSSLIVLFLKCTNEETRSFPSVDGEGRWRLPDIEGNRGLDEHIFYEATDEVMVEVV